MLVLKTEKQATLIVKKSKFIAIAKICPDIKTVKNLVDQTRKQFPDSTHVVHAAIVGNNFSFSDDKEPKNTAGRPALEVLKGSGISNICVLIVRYFGGTLLGTGGLVKAYGDSVKAVLENIETEELVIKEFFSFSISYSSYETVKRQLESFTISGLEEKFESEIMISGYIAASEKEGFSKLLSDLSNGNCRISFSGSELQS